MPFPPLPPPLAAALADRGYDAPTPVQSAVLATDTDGRDLLVSARTGSGKTVAFGIAFASDLLEGDRLPQAGRPLALVVAPTRELALQVHGELSWLYAAAGGRVAASVGGMDPRREARAFASGAHIVVGTPGRLRDHIERGQLDPSALRVVVLDEADEMLDLGFRDELEFILGAAPAERRTLLFSATLPPPIVSLARRFQRDALRLDAAGGAAGEPHADIAYEALTVAPGEIVPAVVNVLRFHDAPLAIVFCATRDNVRALWTALTNRGFDAVALSGELSQNDRNQALHALRAGRARVCVATDVAARGLDLPALSLVVHAELPTNAPLLLHRSGRTGRAGRKGTSLLLVLPPRRRRAETLLREARVRADWGDVPSADAIRRRDHERLLADPALGEPPDDDEAEAARGLLANRDPEQVAVALLRLRRASLPEEAPVTAMTRERPYAAARLGADEHGGSSRAERGGPQRADRGGSPHAERGARHAALANPVWLSASVGRRDKADPKWLLPLLCRVGEVTRREIGAIRVLDQETRFEVSAETAGRFLEGATEGDLRITASVPPQAGASERPGPPMRGGPQRPRPARRADAPPGARSSRRRSGA